MRELVEYPEEFLVRGVSRRGYAGHPRDPAWANEEDLGNAFADVAGRAAACRFGECRHGTAPGCAVRAALASGEITDDRMASHRKLEAELASLERQKDQRKALAEKARWKAVHKAQR